MGHGKFGKIESKLSFSIQRARHLMKLATEWPVDGDRWQEICGVFANHGPSFVWLGREGDPPLPALGLLRDAVGDHWAL